jgi:hypothetical protein
MEDELTHEQFAEWAEFYKFEAEQEKKAHDEAARRHR